MQLSTLVSYLASQGKAKEAGCHSSLSISISDALSPSNESCTPRNFPLKRRSRASSSCKRLNAKEGESSSSPGRMWDRFRNFPAVSEV